MGGISRSHPFIVGRADKLCSCILNEDLRSLLLLSWNDFLEGKNARGQWGCSFLGDRTTHLFLLFLCDHVNCKTLRLDHGICISSVSFLLGLLRNLTSFLKNHSLFVSKLLF